nr:ATS3-like protein [Euphorbia tirucalli]
MSRTVTFLVFLALLFTLSQSRLLNPLPQTFRSLKINTTTATIQTLQRGCTYIVEIVTSCGSPVYTRDHISIAFGDAYNNQVYVPRLDAVSSSTFKRCSKDTFQISGGPCLHQLCYFYVKRSGYDGWKPETVTVYGNNIGTVTFTYNRFVPGDVWYGFNLCNDRVSASST